MGLMQRAYETYCNMEGEYAGKYFADKKEPLAPVSHWLTSAEIEITIDNDGKFITASKVDDKTKIIFPVTEKSANRTSAPCAHPLIDKLCYLAPCDEKLHKLYIDLLEAWAESDFSHPKLTAVLKYIQGETIISDLLNCGIIKKDNDGKLSKLDKYVRWVIFDESKTPECWRDVELFDSFIKFYESYRGNVNGFCMVTGEKKAITFDHISALPKYGKAKLISNGKGFTYLGRFTDYEQALSISYEASQKAHNALRWVVMNSGVVFGNRTFVCWSPCGEIGVKIQDPLLPYDSEVCHDFVNYQKALASELLGLKTKLPENPWSVVAAFDAATNGRFALTFYSEMRVFDFGQRMHDWDVSCCWYNGKHGVQSPPLISIANFAYGTPHKENDFVRYIADEKIASEQIQRLIFCKVYKKPIPLDIMRGLVNRASMPHVFDNKNWRASWNALVYVTCSVIQKYHSQKAKGELCMSWDLDYADRSFQFGRLLAVMEKVERNYYYQKKIDERMPLAIKSLPKFRRNPLSISSRIDEELKKSYLDRMDVESADFYSILCGRIMTRLSEICDITEMDKPLSELYFIGYTLQKNELYKSGEKSDSEEINETEETEE